MQFSESWLRTLVDPKMTSDALSHMLTMSGLEVEEVEPVAPPFSIVVVARVVEVAKHPNADRLNVCQVDAGTGTLLNIVCGAPNVRVGLKVSPRHIVKVLLCEEHACSCIVNVEEGLQILESISLAQLFY